MFIIGLLDYFALNSIHSLIRFSATNTKSCSPIPIFCTNSKTCSPIPKEWSKRTAEFHS